MIIQIDGQEYVVPVEERILLLKQFQALALSEWSKLDETWRILAKPIAREILRKMEESVRRQHGKEASLLLRPAKGKDPVLHLTEILLGVFQEGMKHVSLSIQTDSDTVADLAVSIARPSAGRGQVAADGDERLRQDHGLEIS
jgi:hypothetical protein